MKKANLLSKGILLSILSFGSYGCSDSLLSPEPKIAEEQAVEKVKVLTRNNISLIYLPTQLANIYNVMISWPDYDGDVYIKSPDGAILLNSAQSTEQLISNLQGGIEKTYVVVTTNKDRGIKSEIEIKLLPPKDLVIHGIMSLVENTSLTYGRIFLQDDLKIYTNQFCLKLKFNELIVSNRVHISGYPLNQKAQPNTQGQDSGCVEIKGKSATGFLKIYINSESGGDGDIGFPRCLAPSDAEQNTDCYGLSGKNAGRRGDFEIDVENTENFSIDYSFIEVSGGLRGANSNINQDYISRNKICAKFRDRAKPQDLINRFNSCGTVSVDGENAHGGKICIKLNKDSNYDCVEKD